MPRSTLLLPLLLICSALMLEGPEAVRAQSRPASGGAAAQPASGAQITKEEVNAFMQHTFGWNPDLKWEVTNISPSEAPGITEADVNVATPQGQQPLVLFITADGKYAI